MSSTFNNWAAFQAFIIQGALAGTTRTFQWWGAGLNVDVVANDINEAGKETVLRSNDFCIWTTERSGNPRLIVPKLLIYDPDSFFAFNGKTGKTGVTGETSGKLSMQGRSDMDDNFGILEVLSKYLDATDGAMSGEGVIQVHTKSSQLLEDYVIIDGTIENTQIRMSESAADPTNTDFRDGFGGFHKNTTSGNVFACVNDGGTIKKIQLV